MLFAGVLYHLRHPLFELERVAKLVSSELIVEMHLDAMDYDRPAMVFYPGAELNSDDTNWWGPNRACVELCYATSDLRTWSLPLILPHRAASFGPSDSLL
jgi:hypothetical protein